MSAVTRPAPSPFRSLVRCKQCNGRGKQGRGLLSHACQGCDGRGKTCAMQNTTSFRATQGADLYAEATSLEALAQELVAVSEMLEGDLIVWRLAPECAPRAVAMLTITVEGQASWRKL